MKSELQELVDSVALMELCSQLEAEQEKILAALPPLRESFAKQEKESYALVARAAAIEKRLGEIAGEMQQAGEATRAEFARLETAIATRAREIADYSKRLESEVSAPVEAKIRALFAEMPMPKNGKDGKDGKDGSNVSLLTGFRGNWNDSTTYQPGEWFTFRGSSYLVLRTVRGQIPTRISQEGGNPFYAVMAMSGAPGLPPVVTNITQQSGLESIVVGTRSYAITFSPAFGAAPSFFAASVRMPDSNGEVLGVSNEPPTATGVTVWLTGKPTAASSGGKINWTAIA